MIIQSEGKNRTSRESEAFNKLLKWLDSDGEQAVRKYIEIEQKLIRFLAARGCPCPEELKDTTMERVVEKIMDPQSSLVENYVGEPIAYFYAVARIVHLEYLRDSKPPHRRMPVPVEASQTEDTHICLENCLKRETPQDRKLIIEYYQGDRRAKINHRNHLAKKIGIESNALRIRVCRIRKNLRKCIEECLKKS